MTDAKAIKEKILQRGHFRVVFRPALLKPDRLRLAQCAETVRSLRVKFRGWDYPHYPSSSKETDLTNGDSWYQGVVDWSAYKELWRMYCSGQFIHLAGFREDWYEESGFREEQRLANQGKVLNVVGTLLYVSAEIFEFLSRLVRSGIYTEEVAIQIDLNHMQGRTLYMDDSARLDFFDPYRCDADSIKWAKTLKLELMLAQPEKIAAEFSRHVLERFKLNEASKDLVEGAIHHLRERRA